MNVESNRKITIAVNGNYAMSVESYHCNGYLSLLLVAKYHVMAVESNHKNTIVELSLQWLLVTFHLIMP